MHLGIKTSWIVKILKPSLFLIFFFSPLNFKADETQYFRIYKLFNRGDYERKNFEKEVKLLTQAIKEEPRYFPYYSLLSKIYRIQGETGKAIELWNKLLSLNPPRKWKIIATQHLAALKDRKKFKVKVSGEGFLDLIEVYNCQGITRDHVRYVNDFSLTPQGITFEEKHLPNILACPRNVRIKFQLPCLPYIDKREDLDFFLTAIKCRGQELEIEPSQIYHSLHILGFSVSGDKEKGIFTLIYTDESQKMEVEFSDWINREPSHEPVYRDSEKHFCNGEETSDPLKPLWMFHYSILLKEKILKKIILPKKRGIRIIALTLK